MDKHPNILFILSDQHNAKVLGHKGHPNARTPHLDRMAGQGVRFDNAITQNPICTPSRVSWLSGQYCHNQQSRRYVRLIQQAEIAGCGLAASPLLLSDSRFQGDDAPTPASSSTHIHPFVGHVLRSKSSQSSRAAAVWAHRYAGRSRHNGTGSISGLAPALVLAISRWYKAHPFVARFPMGYLLRNVLSDK